VQSNSNKKKNRGKPGREIGFQMLKPEKVKRKCRSGSNKDEGGKPRKNRNAEGDEMFERKIGKKLFSGH